MTIDNPTITNRETARTERFTFTVDEFDSGVRLLSIQALNGSVDFCVHLAAEEWGQFQTMVSEFDCGAELLPNGLCADMTCPHSGTSDSNKED